MTGPTIATASPTAARYRPLILVIVLVGLGLRVWLCDLATEYGYWADHFDNIGMGLTVEKNGLPHIYSVQKQDLATVRGYVWANGRFQPAERQAVVLPNYPPLAPTMFWAQDQLLRAIGGPIRANTLTSRAVMASLPALAELVTAFGVMLLATRLYGQRAGIVAGLVTWFFPPIAMNSTLWGQIDAMFLAPCVWCVWFMLTRRWALAGLMVGLAAMIKPQGILLGPIVLAGILMVGRDAGRVALKELLFRALKTGGAAVATATLVALPWMLTDGMAWFYRCYVYSFTQAFPHTTLMAFNVWYADLLTLDGQLVDDARNSQALLFGLSKDLVGRLALLATMCGLAGVAWWRYRARPELAVVLVSGLFLWAVFMWPTRVHERFIIYCMPLMIAAGIGLRRYWPVLLVLAVVGAAEHSWNIWLAPLPAGAYDTSIPAEQLQRATQQYIAQTAAMPPDRRPPPPNADSFLLRYNQRYQQLRRPICGWEWTITIFSIGAFAWAMLATVWPPGGPKRAAPTMPAHQAAHGTLA